MTHLNALSAPQAERDRPLLGASNPLDIKNNYASSKPSEDKTHIHFKETINLLELDLLKKPSETQEEETCFPAQEISKIPLPELFKKAEACHAKAQEELEKAYNAGEWEKVIRASKSAIAAIEWRNSISTRDSTPITGIGVQIERDKESGETRVINTINDSPADKGDIRKGDIITRVNKNDTRDLGIIQTMELIKGAAGSEVRLTIKRDNDLIEKRIVRAALSGSPTTVALGREYGILHHAYSKLDKVEEARALYPRARKEIESEFGASSDALLVFLHKQALLVLWKHPKEVEPLANEAIEIIERQNAPNKIQELWGMDNLAGYSLLNAGENEKAAAYIDKSIFYYEHNKGSASPALTEALTKNLVSLATSCQYSNITTTKCKNYSDIAYQMAMQHLSPSRSEYRKAIWIRANNLSETEPIESWLPLYKQVIELEEKYENLNTRAITLTALAMKLATTETNEAIRLQSKAIKLIEEKSGEKSFESLTYQLKLADIYRFSGLRDSAYNKYTEVYNRLQQMPRTGEYADSQLLRIYGELTKGLMPLGKTDIVRILLARQIEITEEYPDNIWARFILMNANAYYSALIDSNYSKALEYYAEAERIFRSGEELYLKATDQNPEWAKGIRRSELEAIRIELYESMAVMQALMHDYAAASRTLEEAIQYVNTPDSSQKWQLKYLYAALAKSQAAQDDLASSEINALQALELAKKDPVTADSFYLLAGVIAGLRQKPEVAYPNLINFANARAKALSEKLWRNPDQSRRIELIDTGLEGLEYLFYDYGENGLYNRAALHARLNLQGLSAEVEQKSARIAAADPKTKEIIIAIQSAARQAESPELSSQAKEVLYEEIVRSENLLLKRMPDLVHKPTSVDEVAKSLPSNAVLVEFQKVSSYPRINRAYPVNQKKTSRYIALSLDHHGAIRRFELGDASLIDHSIEKAVRSLSAGLTDSTQLWADAGSLLLRPLGEILASKSIIYISPDSETSRFPFTDADIFNPNDMLRPGTQIRIVTTGRDIAALKKASKSNSQAAVVANPDFGLGATRHSTSSNPQDGTSASAFILNKLNTWNPLPATEKEGVALSNLIKAKLLTKDMANEQAVKELISPKILHFASHAFFQEQEDSSPEKISSTAQNDTLTTLSGIGLNSGKSPTSKVQSGIVLAGANDLPQNQSFDGYLTADEIARLEWSGTELVVVSGCDSAVTISRSGDGLYGLRRSIAVAGARSSLLSLWKVEDVATAEFMTRFYARLKAGSARSDAVAQTQREFRDGTAGGGRWKDPYYWAAWQLVGEWGPLKGL